MMNLIRRVEDCLLLTEDEKNASYDYCPEAREEHTHKSRQLILQLLANEDHASAEHGGLEKIDRDGHCPAHPSRFHEPLNRVSRM
jgi:hypothetical protein